MPDFPSFQLDGQTALVTGAARGLGRAISLALAHAGADVALGLRDPAGGADLAEQIEAMGRRVRRVAMDVRDLRQVGSAVEQTVAHEVHELGELLVSELNRRLEQRVETRQDWLDRAQRSLQVWRQRTRRVMAR